MMAQTGIVPGAAPPRALTTTSQQQPSPPPIDFLDRKPSVRVRNDPNQTVKSFISLMDDSDDDSVQQLLDRKPPARKTKREPPDGPNCTKRRKVESSESSALARPERDGTFSNCDCVGLDLLRSPLLESDDFVLQLQREDQEMKEHEGMLSTLDGRAILFTRDILEIVSSPSPQGTTALTGAETPGQVEPVAEDNLVDLAMKTMELWQEFASLGKPTHVRIGYHYTSRTNLESIRTNGLLSYDDQRQVGKGQRKHGSHFGEGVYCGSNPTAFANFGDCGLMVAMLIGTMSPRLPRRYINGPQFQFDTVLGNKKHSRRGRNQDSSTQEVVGWDDDFDFDDEIVLTKSTQCLPLLHFDRASIPDNALHFHKKCQAVIDRYFNNSVSTPVRPYLTRDNPRAIRPGRARTQDMPRKSFPLSAPTTTTPGVLSASLPPTSFPIPASGVKAMAPTAGTSPTKPSASFSLSMPPGSASFPPSIPAPTQVSGINPSVPSVNGPLVQAQGTLSPATLPPTPLLPIPTSPVNSATATNAVGQQKHPSPQGTFNTIMMMQQQQLDAARHLLKDPNNMDSNNYAFVLDILKQLDKALSQSLSQAQSVQDAMQVMDLQTQLQPLIQLASSPGKGRIPVNASAASILSPPQLPPVPAPARFSRTVSASTTAGLSKFISTPAIEELIYDAPQSLLPPSIDGYCRPLRMATTAQTCPICLDPIITNKMGRAVLLKSCCHFFHAPCLTKSLHQDRKCPVCRVAITAPQGKSPSGTMTIKRLNSKCGGYNDCGTIEIVYNMKGGVQKSYHDNPGARYGSTHRTAYLPDNLDGQELLKRLKYAWQHGLTFRVGTSLTSGQLNCITWASIHHKTSTRGGAHGFPDPNFFSNCNDELDALAVPSSHKL